MNIQNFMPSSVESITDGRPLHEHLDDLVATRTAVFQQFGRLEVANGGRRDVFQPLWSKAGQDTARNFLMRSIEEILEAIEAREPEHMMEELVDSFFYLYSIRILDPSYESISSKADELEDMLVSWERARPPYPVTPTFEMFELPAVLLGAMSQFLATLRNRTWQNQVQQPYFTGQEELNALIETWIHCYLPYFGSVQEFLIYCRAKHHVLIFRLETHY